MLPTHTVKSSTGQEVDSRTIVHEVGHILVAELLNCTVTAVQLESGNSFVECEPIVPDTVEDAILSVAGVAAEIVVFGRIISQPQSLVTDLACQYFQSWQHFETMAYMLAEIIPSDWLLAVVHKLQRDFILYGGARLAETQYSTNLLF